MSGRNGIYVLVGLAFVGLLGSAAIRTQGLSAQPDFGDVSRAVSAVTLLAIIYDGLLWRWLSILGAPPPLFGTWKMLLTPKAGPEGSLMDAKAAYLSVSQTANKIDVKIFFDDGKSLATNAAIEQSTNKRLLLFYDFEPNQPTPADPHRKGAASLEITTRGLDGKYWNDAQMWGNLKSEGRTTKRYDSYESAAEHQGYL